MNIDEARALLRECRAALDDLVCKKPGIEALHCGSTTLGNLRAELGAVCKYQPPVIHGYVIEKVAPDWHKLTAYSGDQRLVYFGYTPEHVKVKAGLLRDTH